MRQPPSNAFPCRLERHGEEDRRRGRRFVLDVKMGKAAFALIDEETNSRGDGGIAVRFRPEAVAWISAMDQPLGPAVGNAHRGDESGRALEARARRP